MDTDVKECTFATCLELGRDDSGVYAVGPNCVLHTRFFEDIGLVWGSKRRRGEKKKQTAASRALGGWLDDEGEFGVDEGELEALQALGLPLGFGSTQPHRRGGRQDEAFHAAVAATEEAAGPCGGADAAAGVAIDAPSQAPAHSNGGLPLGAPMGLVQAVPTLEQLAWQAAAAAQGSVDPSSPWQQAWDASTGHFYYYNEAVQQTRWDVPPEGFRAAPYEWAAAALAAGHADAGHHPQVTVAAQQGPWLSASELEQQLRQGAALQQQQQHAAPPLGQVMSVSDLEAKLREAAAVGAADTAAGAATAAAGAGEEAGSAAVAVNGDARPAPSSDIQQGEPQQQVGSGPSACSAAAGPTLLHGLLPPSGSHTRFASDSDDEAAAGALEPGQRGAPAAAEGEQVEQLAAEMQHMMAVSSAAAAFAAQDLAVAVVESIAQPAAEAAAPAGDDACGEQQQKKARRKNKKKGQQQEGGGGGGADTDQGGAGAARQAASGRRHVQLPAEMDQRLQKYWLQRYSLFSRFDDGIQVDDQGWYSVTPEVVAAHHAQRAVDVLGPDCVACDAFAGAGGNVIQFALRCRRVVAVEIDEGRLAMLRNNARVYGVDRSVQFVHGDFFQHARNIKADVVFYSPPWGGPEYASQRVYDVELMGGQGFGLKKLLDLAFGTMGARAVIAFLPRNCDLRQLATILPEGHSHCEVEREMLNNVCKGLTIYYGELARRPAQVLQEAAQMAGGERQAPEPAGAPQQQQQQQQQPPAVTEPSLNTSGATAAEAGNIPAAAVGNAREQHKPGCQLQ